MTNLIPRLPQFFGGVILTLLSALGWTHSGGLDAHGGHTNKQNGNYHCHREPCLSTKQNVIDATQEAIRENRSFNQVYRREDYRHWSDFDNDCMNTRHEILAANSLIPPKLSPDGCYVSSGRWTDPFSGRIFTKSSDLDVDHVVPLKWAHTHGASNWPLKQKELFANDPENLLAVDDALNQAKGARGPDAWMPPNSEFHCIYLDKWYLILRKYRLEMTAREMQVFTSKLQTCKK